MKKVVVTRHKALVEYLVKHRYIEQDTEHLTRAEIVDVKDKHVFGILPNWLACHASKMTEIQLRLPAEKRGTELTVEEIEFYIVKPRTYNIEEVKE